MVKLKSKAPAAAFAVPQTRDQAVEAIAEIGRRARERQRIEAAMNDEMAVIKQRFQEQAAPHDLVVRDLTRGVQVWAEANRYELTDGLRVKTARLPSGEIKWRIDPPSVRIQGTEAVMELLERAGLDRMVRTRREINKEAILADPAAVAGIAGIRIAQDETFLIEPFEAVLAEGV